MSSAFSANHHRIVPTALSTEINPNLTTNPLESDRLGLTASSNNPIVGQPLLVYDGNTNQLINSNEAAPDAPWFFYQDTTDVLSGNATPTTTGNGTRLTTDNQAYAGYINYRINATNPLNPQLATLNNNFPVLDATTGYIISFTAQLESETTRSGADKNGDNIDDRAGFSVVVIGNDKTGIELGFWENEIWAQNDGEAEPTPGNLNNTLFTHGEGINFDTTAKAVKYDLAIIGDTYSLFADNNQILTGSVRNYSAFQPSSYNVLAPNPIGGGTITVPVTPPDPYEQPNFVFFGDNTPTAGATVNIQKIAITTNQTIPNQTINSGKSTTALPFTVADVDDDSLTITATSNNQTLIPNILIEGTGTERTIKVISAPEQTGTAKITLTITDNNTNPVIRSFDVTVNEGQATKHDVNGDSKADILWRNLNTGENALWTLDGFAIDNAAFITPEIVDKNWKLITTGDFNGDKKADMLWRNSATGENAIWLRNGFNDLDTNSKQSITLAPIGWEIIDTGDLDGNGKDDIVWRNQTTGENAVWLMDGFTVNAQYLSNQVTPISWEMAGVGDFDNDDKADIVWRNQATGGNAIWLMNGATVKESRFITNIVDLNWQIADVGDSNADGKDDIVWRNQATGETAIWFVNTAQLNGQNFAVTSEFVVNQSAIRIQVTPNWQLEAIADYNGDDQVDFLWRNYSTGETALWWMNGSTATNTELITANGSAVKNDPNWEITL